MEPTTIIYIKSGQFLEPIQNIEPLCVSSSLSYLQLKDTISNHLGGALSPDDLILARGEGGGFVKMQTVDDTLKSEETFFVFSRNTWSAAEQHRHHHHEIVEEKSASFSNGKIQENQSLGFKIVTVYNNKGGVGKTTICCNLADKLSSKGFKVLVVDTDVQLNSTLLFFDRLKARSDNLIHFETYWNDMDLPYAEMVKSGKHIQEERITFYNQLELVLNEGISKRIDLRDPVKITPNLDLIPGDMRMFYLNDELQSYMDKANKENMRKIRALLAAYGQDCYDFVLIDMSPASDFLNQTLWFSSDYIIMPATYDKYSKIALPNLSKWIERIWLQRHKFWIDNPEGYRPKVIAVTCTGFKKYGGEMSISHQEDSKNMGEELEKFCVTMSHHRMIAGSLFSNAKAWYDSHILTALNSAKAKLGDNIMESLNADFSAKVGVSILEIRDYSKLMLVFQNCCKPVYALSSKDLRKVKATLDNTYKLHREEVNLMFEFLAYLIVQASEQEKRFEYRSAEQEEVYWNACLPASSEEPPQKKQKKPKKGGRKKF